MVASVVMLNSRVLKALNKDMQDLAFDLAGETNLRQPLLDSAKKVIAPSIHQNFVSSGRPDRWEEVGTSAYRKLKGLENTPPLWVTGKLQRSASAMSRFRVKKNELTYGYFPSTLWFAGLLDVGSRKGYGGDEFPARPFAMYQPKDQEDIIRIFGDWVEDQVRNNIRYHYA